ncbi:MAG TPA: hypothetical protein VII40_07485 [Xanthobacteraceae bacterium]|jgi:hypothetical protein
MLKFAGLAAAILFVVCTSIPARADCPDGRCPNGTILPGTRAAQEQERAAEAQRRAAETQRARGQCLGRCETFCNQGMKLQCGQCKWSCDH